jgi:hypothetical protein
MAKQHTTKRAKYMTRAATITTIVTSILAFRHHALPPVMRK